MGLYDQIKKDIKNSASSKGKLLFLKPESKVRIRFLSKFDDGIVINMHDSFEDGINSICYEHIGHDCPDCIHKNKDIRTRENYAWTVFDIDAKEVKVFVFAANNFTPIPMLASFFHTYGNITDRDYVIERNGKGKGYNVIPMDKAIFRNTKVKALSEEKILKFVYEANHLDDEEEHGINVDDETEEEKETIEENNYSDMTPKELYKLCKEREIDAEIKKKKSYYVELLEANDEDDWGDGEDEDDEDIW